MNEEQLKDLVVAALEDVKGIDIQVLDVRQLTDMTDYMIVASGSSGRQIKALVDNVVLKCKEAGRRPLGVEGERSSEWMLVDMEDVVVHVMLPTTRDFYQLEKLWDAEISTPSPTESEA
ncbi:MAG: ribosome silencing factor [Gammaproteobacteria bacterium]|nr:ribosome silencing factor [Gammaproteobacteria bacterium]